MALVASIAIIKGTAILVRGCSKLKAQTHGISAPGVVSGAAVVSGIGVVERTVPTQDQISAHWDVPSEFGAFFTDLFITRGLEVSTYCSTGKSVSALRNIAKFGTWWLRR